MGRTPKEAFETSVFPLHHMPEDGANGGTLTRVGFLGREEPKQLGHVRVNSPSGDRLGHNRMFGPEFPTNSMSSRRHQSGSTVYVGVDSLSHWDKNGAFDPN
jgi:hypothetical protein